ncbi:PREDICTED: dual specificity protein phosphatase 26-like isoform X2 [Cyprinodon variegatus]|uniref:dual specificity protein phosphatase 26-like isoform X2 n=1 Tax=Cyprinodon variegatus TaxID=28743 RepID=UPI000742508B|nr:PREDICTED: dual specificity protein phosphatase 26-like isoform X2 [Cyprinodon variegatus]
MAFMSRFSRSRSSSRSPSRKDSDRDSQTLTVSELERLLYTGKTACNHADEVWPRLYIGDQNIASDRRELARLGITHILNCAQSKWRGGAEYYAGMNITYHGIEAHDSPTFDMSVNFYPAAEFIHKALSAGGFIPVIKKTLQRKVMEPKPQSRTRQVLKAEYGVRCWSTARWGSAARPHWCWPT